MTVRVPAILLALVFLASSSNVSVGQTLWTAGVGDWFDNNNWSIDAPNSASGTSFDAIIANGGTAQLQAPGGSVRRMRVGLAGGPGNLLVNGGALNVTDDLHLNEGSAGPASMTVQGASTVTAVDTVVGFSSASSTSFLISDPGTAYNATTSFIVGQSGAGLATLTVQNGAVLASGTSLIGTNLIGNNGFGTATVTGAGSRWSSTGAFTVGSGVAANLTIQNQGLVHVGTALSIGATSNLNLNGGTLRFNTIATGISRINYNSGTLQLAGNRDILFDQLLFDFYGLSRIIPASKGLTIEGTTTIRQEKSLTVSGGTLTSQGALLLGGPGGSGSLFVNSGGKVIANADSTMDQSSFSTVSGAGSTWTVAGNLLLASGDLIISNQASLYVGNTLSFGSNGLLSLNGGTVRFNGYSRDLLGVFTYAAGTVQLAGNRTIGSDAAITDLFGAAPTIPTGKALIVEGTALLTPSSPVTLSGGTLSAETVLMTPGSRLANTQPTQVPGAMLALAGSVIDATGANLTVGNATKVNGFYGAGMLQVGQRTVTLADANDAVLDSAALVTLGAGGAPGTLAAANGLTLDFGGNVIGYGAIETPNSAATPLINNGHITGASVTEPITLPGYVKGVGTLDNVDVTGTLAPGFSPATVTLGSVAYAGQLEIELGGTALGSFDRLEHTLGAGIAQLGGSLIVSLINGFVPALGDSFEFLTANGGVNGTFASETLPNLASGLGWNVNYAANSVVLEVTAAPSFTADFDEDGDVDGADLTEWRNDFGPAAGSDADNDGDSDGADFLAWQQQLGSGPAVPVAGSVPEPTAGVLLLLGFTARMHGRRHGLRRVR